MSVERFRRALSRPRSSHLIALSVLLLAGALFLGGCATEAEESNTPTNELPAEGQAAMYEFYTDS